MRSGSECAVKSTWVRSSGAAWRASASPRRAASNDTSAGSAYQGPTATRGVDPRASAARSTYSCEPMDEPCGVSTRPMTRSTPLAASVAAVSSMSGSVCLAPNDTV